MATIKVKFRKSKIESSEGIIIYQVVHNCVVRQINTNYHLYVNEWDSDMSDVVLSKNNEERISQLKKIRNNIRTDIKYLQTIIFRMEYNGKEYTTNDITEQFLIYSTENKLFLFMERLIANQKMLGKIRLSETYASALRSLKRFREGEDIDMKDIDSDMIKRYEIYLRNRGVTPNTSSFYMRNLRAIYNRAVEKGLIFDKKPFKNVYTGIDKTIKRAVSLKIIKKIKELDFSAKPTFEFARDMFLFSFYTRGMSFVDMAYLRKKDLSNGVLSYRRRKTGQQLYIRWEKCMQDIVEKYDNTTSLYLLPIIKPISNIEERKQYIYAAHNINHSLKIIGKKLEISVPLTMYVARHAWASIAKNKNVPLSVISEGMGHNSEATTRIYLASLDTVAIDKANNMILKLI
ncbi:MAG: site-specific integrase [Bacteroidales bacterium]|nr:site-specific integrase [Bacteroidales bacterium]